MRLLRYLLLALCLTSVSAWADTQDPVITILHTNDTHSQVEPYVNKDGKVKGGVVERASMLELYRAQEDDELLYLDAGDMVQGSPYFNIFDGKLEMLCMSQQRLIATTFGNHEFDNGIAFIDSMMQWADFPILSCNYHCDSTQIAGRVRPHLIVERKGVKIGLTGVTCDPKGLIFARHYEGIRYEDPRTAVNREAAELRRQGCDLVIVLSHLGYIAKPRAVSKTLYDTDLAQAVQGVDIIIGAHTHVNMEHGLRVSDAFGRPVFITQTGGKANPIGYLQVRMKEGSIYPGCHYQVDSIVCRKLHPEKHDLTGRGEAMRQLIAPYQAEITRQLDGRLGTAPEMMEKGRPQSLLGNFATDALRVIGERITGKKIDVAILNVGGIRSDMLPGEVTRRQIFNIFPFENTVNVLEVKGSDLKEVIDHSAGKKLEAMSGTQIELHMEGNRVVAGDIKVGGEPLDPERYYTLCTINYLAEGNDGMTALTRARSRIETGITIRQAMMDYITDLDAKGLKVESQLDDRIIDNAHK